jgi:molybdenum cofactor biosynthesis enzyme MoaA
MTTLPRSLAVRLQFKAPHDIGKGMRTKMADQLSVGTHDGSTLVDSFGRAITYVRVSVTDRCDFRCVYCMAEDMAFLPRRELLTIEELDRLCSAFIEMGTRKIRITGGEPLVRRDIMGLFRSLSQHLEAGTLQEMTLTTNGSQLARFADELASCGVRRINVSLDTLDPGRFKAITRRGDLDRVLSGIDAAQRAGLSVGPARYVRVGETGGLIGFITPLTHNFCETCNRVRVTCTGKLYMCLGHEDAADLRTPLRQSEENELLVAATREAIARKPKGHDFVVDRTNRHPAVERHMSVTGG